MKILKFDAPLILSDKGGAYVDVPFDVEKEFGAKRPKIKAQIRGIKYRGILARMKTSGHILIILKEIREKLNAKEGDLLDIAIQVDTEERIIDIPDIFKDLLIEEELLSYFDSLAFTHRKEFVRWVNEAKKQETREKRLLAAIEKLKNKENLS